jgi:hypothetical protein
MILEGASVRKRKMDDGIVSVSAASGEPHKPFSLGENVAAYSPSDEGQVSV